MTVWTTRDPEYRWQQATAPLADAIVAMEHEMMKYKVCQEQGLTTGPPPRWAYQTYEEVEGHTPWHRASDTLSWRLVKRRTAHPDDRLSGELKRTDPIGQNSCPKCGAKPGQRCLAPKGQSYTHLARIRESKP